MAKIQLPTEKRKAVLNSPQRIVLFSKPKVGKTITCSMLPKSLILDFEKGSLAIDAMAVQLTKYSDVDEVCAAIKEAGYPYMFGIIDTASALEEMCLSQAEINYAKSPDGKDWFLADENKQLHPKSGKAKYGSIMNLPFGKGYQYVSDVFNEVISKFEKCFPKIIILAHSTYNSITKDGAEITSLDIMMSKKCKFVTTFKADAIGYIYRKGAQNFVNFTATEDVGAGGRFRYLEKEHILLSEYKEDDEFVTYWDKIFPSKKKEA